MRFADRRHAGAQLAQSLRPVIEREGGGDAVVIALAPGGVPVGHEVALQLHLPFDALVLGEVGLPENDAPAIAAVSHTGAVVRHDHVIDSMQIPHAIVEWLVASERRSVARRARKVRGWRRARSARGKVAILVDDGLASASMMVVAAEAVAQLRPQRVIAALPVVCSEARHAIEPLVDELVVVARAHELESAADFYDECCPLSDRDAHRCLAVPTVTARERADARARAHAAERTQRRLRARVRDVFSFAR